MTSVAERGSGSSGMAPDTVRVSVLVERMQIDVSLPVDVPVALLIPELVRLRDASDRDAGGASADDARSRVWVLRRRGPGGRLDADDTLRSAGVGTDELLHLVAERTLSAPTLYDDVVDAAAQLNQSRHQGWTSLAARRVAVLAMALVTVAWVLLVLTADGGGQRTALVALSAVAVVGLVAAAVALTRFAAQADAGATLGWSALPIAAAAGWVVLTPYGDLARAAGCAALLLSCAVLPRMIGAGAAGYLTFAVLFCGAVAMLLARAAGAPVVLAGPVVAVLGTAGCLAVPQARRRIVVADPARRSPVDDLTSRVAAERALRAGCFAGLAGVAGLGALVTIRATGSPGWAALVLAWACAGALLLQSTRLTVELERTALAVPAGALAVVAAFVAPAYGVWPAVVGFAVVLAGAIGFAVEGIGLVRPGGRASATLDCARYGVFAALIPVAFWLTVGILGGSR